VQEKPGHEPEDIGQHPPSHAGVPMVIVVVVPDMAIGVPNCEDGKWWRMRDVGDAYSLRQLSGPWGDHDEIVGDGSR
jgi:hypothetical protein